MGLDDRITDWLAAHRGKPQSVAQISAAIPEASLASIERACMALRAQRELGRNGAGTSSSPYRFYLKRS